MSDVMTRAPGHTITPLQISMLVDDFYERVRAHPRLGPIFNIRLDGKWPEHLEKLKAFWRSVLLTTGEYNGRPVPAHNKINELEPEDFGLWLDLFDNVSMQHFHKEDAIVVREKARRIARSLWLARFGTPFNAPPNWPMH